MTLRQRALAPATERDDPQLTWLYRRMNGWNPRRPSTFLAPTPGLATWRGSSMPLLRQFGMPMLYIVGEHDRIVPWQAMAASHRAMEGSEFVKVGDAGHSVYLEQPGPIQPGGDRFPRAALADLSGALSSKHEDSDSPGSRLDRGHRRRGRGLA